jgi:DNA-binding NarL/FixJ family response regulator
MTEATLMSYPDNIQKAIQDSLNWQSENNKIDLTQREFEVLYFFSLGWDDNHACKALRITTNTYRAHIRNIQFKLNAHNKIEALAKAFRSGLLKY